MVLEILGALCAMVAFIVPMLLAWGLVSWDTSRRSGIRNQSVVGRKHS